MLLLYLLNILITPLKWALRPVYNKWLVAFPTTEERVATALVFAAACGVAMYYFISGYLLPMLELRFWTLEFAEVLARVTAVAETDDPAAEAIEYFRVWRLLCRVPNHVLDQLTCELADMVREERSLMNGPNANVQYQTARAYMVIDAGTLATFLSETTLTRKFSHREILELIPGMYRFAHLRYSHINLVAYWFSFAQAINSPDELSYMLENCPARILKHMPYPNLPNGYALPGGQRSIDYWADVIAKANTPEEVVRILMVCSYAWVCALPFEGGLVFPVFVFEDGDLFVDVLQRIKECKSFEEVQRIIWVLVEEEKIYKNNAATKVPEPGMLSWLLSYV